MQAHSFLALAGTLLLMASLGAAPLRADTLCEQKHCSFTAERAEPWPACERDAPLVAFRFGPYGVLVPAGWRFAKTEPDGVIFVYEDNRRLSVWLETPASYGLTAEAFDRSSYEFTDLARIIFTQTPADAPANEPSQLAVWKAAMGDKRIHLEGASDGVVFRKSSLTAYLAQTRFQGGTHDAIVTSPQGKATQLRILGVNVGPEVVKNVIGSVSIH